MKYIVILVLTIMTVMTVFADGNEPIQIVAYVGNGLNGDTIWLYNPNSQDINIVDHELEMFINGEPDTPFIFDDKQFSSAVIPGNGYVTVSIMDFSSEGYTRPTHLKLYNGLNPVDDNFSVEYDNLSNVSPLSYTTYMPMVTK